MAKKKKQTAKTKTAKAQAQAGGGIKLIAVNRKVRHRYEVLKDYEAGIVLQGSEVKSLRESNVQWADAHARVDDRTRELWLWGLYIGEYRQATHFNHLPTAPRKLLLHRRQIDQIAGMLQTKGLTVVPRQIYFKRGMVKVEICVVRGKKQHDRREELVRRSQQRDAERELARRG